MPGPSCVHDPQGSGRLVPRANRLGVILRAVFKSDLNLFLSTMVPYVLENLDQRGFLIALQDKAAVPQEVQGAEKLACAVLLFIHAISRHRNGEEILAAMIFNVDVQSLSLSVLSIKQ